MHFAHDAMGDDSLDIDLDAIIQMTRAISEAPRSTEKTQHQDQPHLSESIVFSLCRHARILFADQPVLLNLEAPVVVFGDIHGQIFDLFAHFDAVGWPGEVSSEQKFLFLGDLVDRGKYSMETICLLFAMAIKYPKQVFLLRGNHECASVNRIYGFYDDCKRRYSIKVWKTFTDTFNHMPLVAIISGKILCMHGGLSPQMTSLSQLETHQRPNDPEHPSIASDVLWSDPSQDINGWGESDRGVGYTFGPNVVRDFLAKMNLDLICRAHQVVEDGYEFFCNRRLVTVFSASNYCGEFDNAGAVMTVSSQLVCAFSILKPRGKLAAVTTR